MHVGLQLMGCVAELALTRLANSATMQSIARLPSGLSLASDVSDDANDSCSLFSQDFSIAYIDS